MSQDLQPRFEPHAAGEMASMFDDVSGRYDFLNRVMTLGQDGAWREAMWRAVPEDAHVVLDLCTGSGVSLPGLRRPGRVVLGMDVSFQMLEVAQAQYGTSGWAPRIACSDAFRLPLRDGSLDAITIAFGVRNLRPRPAALAELARVLRPGGTLVVLEASAPAPGALHPFHAFWVRHMIPLFGRLSPDPSAYRYLSASIFEFGHGPEFVRDMAAQGFTLVREKAFLLGATRLWVARRGGAVGQNHAADSQAVRNARGESGENPQSPRGAPAVADEARAWLGVQALTSGALTAALGYAVYTWLNFRALLPLTEIQRFALWTLLIAGLVLFGARTVWLGLRFAAAGKGSDRVG
ncbi:MAG: ubiquinone/menaquinone biosynthesis methyltransferase [Candidatus Eisenbacteria bacterium]|uniref:Ubiquinone/menaquinone biosynthesis methyltransferase n=1 Tax=Eiseniibacteriota bacterium TaxID=2212470 RepID=A0A933SA41_UNCEI|nr:ubiquinone/menaquinone biosynthesis methyltransferase [Candidatus Eisenbacteria bacterium]